jgi:hypothetical protein
LLGIPRNSVAYKEARAQWFKTIRNAKRECWQKFLQQSDTDAVWKTINEKPARHAMPTLRIPGNDNSVKLASTQQEKVPAISAISIPDKDDDPTPPIPEYRPGVPDIRPVCPKGINELLSTTSNTSAPGQDGIRYQTLRLWAKIDYDGLCNLMNLLITQGLPKELKTAKVGIGKPGQKDMSNPKSYRCISLLSNVAKLIEKAVAQYLTLEGEVHGWWHSYQFGSRPGKNTTDALMWLKAVVEKNRKEIMNTALIMTDVAAAFPGTRPSTVRRTLAPLVDLNIYRSILDSLSDRSIALSVVGIQSPQQSSRCGIPQGSPLSPVCGLVCAATLKGLPSGASYVDDCSWAIPFSSPQQLQRDSHRLLDAVQDRFEMHGLSLDTGKLEIAFISKNTQTSKRFKIDSKRWKVNWGRKLLMIRDSTRWLGCYLDPFLNWQAHVKIRVQQGLWRQQNVARFMQRWGINSKLARTVA